MGNVAGGFPIGNNYAVIFRSRPCGFTRPRIRPDEVVSHRNLQQLVWWYDHFLDWEAGQFGVDREVFPSEARAAFALGTESGKVWSLLRHSGLAARLRKRDCTSARLFSCATCAKRLVASCGENAAVRVHYLGDELTSKFFNQ